MSEIILEAEARALIGKGASRRLRRLDDKVPAVIYGGEKASQAIQFMHRHVIKVLESEKVYSSVFDITVDGKKERVILKDLQRHPYKAVILHMDLQRVSSKDVLVKTVPLHFLGEEDAPGVSLGGVVSHAMTQVDVRCEAQHLPEFIEVDIAAFEMDQALHLSQLNLPKHVELAVDVSDAEHDHLVVNVHEKRVEIEPAEVEEVEEAEEANLDANDTDNASEGEETPAAE
jgi:large subunit ribosomal protein L25